MRSVSRSRTLAACLLCHAFQFLILPVLLALAANPAFAQLDGETVNRVDIDGLVTYSPDQIKAQLKTRPGQPYRSLDAAEDVRELSRIMEYANFSADRATTGGVNIHFLVREFPRLREIQTVGNVKLKTERVETLLGLKKGDVLDYRVRDSVRRALRTEYQALGMPQARITLNVTPVGEPALGQRAEADLQIIIDEGQQILAKDVIIRGNEAFSGIRLRSLLATKGSWGFIKNYYSDEVFENDLNTLRKFYADRGYFDARVERGRFESAGAVVSPTIEITEGRRYTFGEIEVRGARLFSRGEILDLFKNLSGKPYDAEYFSNALVKLQALYDDHGLLTTRIDPVYSYDADNQKLNVMLNITERNRIYVGRVLIDHPTYKDEDPGASKFRRWYNRVAPPVNDEAISREILLEPGEIYNRSLQEQSRRRLARTGVFDEASLRLTDQPTADPAAHDLVVHVEEVATGLLSGGVGFGDASGGFVYANVTERNVGGNMDTFQFGASIGTRLSQVNVSYLNRHLGDTRDSLLTRVYYHTQAQPGYRANTIGVQSEWGHPLEDDWTRYLRARIEAVDMEERDGVDAKEDLDRLYPVATLRWRMEQDTRTPLVGRAREGRFLSYGVEAGYAGGPLLNFEIMRDRYRPVNETLTWRLYTMAGLMPYQRDLIPINERHFLGGSADMRGFAYRGAGYFDEDDDEVPIGGSAKLLMKNEIIRPLYGPIAGVLFADVGMLGESPVQWQMPRASAGAGLRFDMKRVQVGIDLAAPVLTQEDDQTRFFHFSLDSRF